MNASVRRMIVGATFFLLTCLIAIAGYMMAGWQLLDAIYMVVITVFGVGYGETKPAYNTGLKVFTMGVIIAGCSSRPANAGPRTTINSQQRGPACRTIFGSASLLCPPIRHAPRKRTPTTAPDIAECWSIPTAALSWAC